MPEKLDEVLAKRKASHGSFRAHAGVEQSLKKAMQDSVNWDELPDVHKSGLEMICHKIARALTGNPFHKDNFVDIQGYAARVQEFINETAEEAQANESL